jgi:hypothetical protein
MEHSDNKRSKGFITYECSSENISWIDNYPFCDSDVGMQHFGDCLFQIFLIGVQSSL